VKPVMILFAVILVATFVAMLWQHQRYLGIRREVAQDRQPLLYGGGAFHVVTFLRVAEGVDAIEAVRDLKRVTEGVGGGEWIYAGKVALEGRASSQLEDVEWSAIVVAQFPSRDAYAEAAVSPTWRQALAGFEASYSHGLDRSAWVNLAIPHFLLARRGVQLVTREGSFFPFEPTPDEALPAEVRHRIDQLLRERELGAKAVVVVNLIKKGTSEQQARDRAYGWRMIGAMAERGCGPMHMGRAVTLEGDADFDDVAIVYYPGVAYFAEMLGSSFFQGIIGDKQLGDTQATITVPILSLL
jgi:hypothetical protein